MDSYELPEWMLVAQIKLRRAVHLKTEVKLWYLEVDAVKTYKNADVALEVSLGMMKYSDQTIKLFRIW